MAKTNSERQAEYRAKAKNEGSAERVSFMVSVSTKRQLERLARHYQVTQREALERILSEVDSTVANGMTPVELTKYYDEN